MDLGASQDTPPRQDEVRRTSGESVPEKYLRLANQRRAEMMLQAGEFCMVRGPGHEATHRVGQDMARQRVVTGEGERWIGKGCWAWPGAWELLKSKLEMTQP